jgi:hypothetical protein
MVTVRRSLFVAAVVVTVLAVIGVFPSRTPEPTVTDRQFFKVVVGGEVFVVDAKLFGLFLGDRVTLTREAEKRAGDEALASFTAEISGITDGMMPGVERFEEWYHSWYTKYALLAIAVRAYANADTTAKVSARMAAEAAVRDEFVRQFVEIVVHPEINDRLVADAAERAIARLDDGYAAIATETRRLVTDFVRTAAVADAEVATRADAAPTFVFDEIVTDGARSGTGAVGLPAAGRDAASGVTPDVVDWITGLNANDVVWQAAGASVAWIATVVITPIVTVAMANIGAAITAGAVGVGAGPLAPLAVPTLFAVGLGIAAVTDLSIDNLTSAMRKDEFVASVRGAVTTLRDRLVESFRPALVGHAERLYGGLVGQLETVKSIAP